MSTPSPFQWFIQKMTKELFFVSLSFWLILFLLEVIKNGIVSNYLSLPHLAVGVFVLGVIAMVFDKQMPVSQIHSTKGITKREQAVLLISSLIIAFVIFVTTNFSLLLTLLLIFVTVLALWSVFYTKS